MRIKGNVVRKATREKGHEILSVLHGIIALWSRMPSVLPRQTVYGLISRALASMHFLGGDRYLVKVRSG